MPRTKIVATLGPAGNDYTVLRKMVRAGLDIVRLNFSHGTHRQHLESVDLIRRIVAKVESRQMIRKIDEIIKFTEKSVPELGSEPTSEPCL